MLALDKWTCNTNGRQAAFWKKSRDKKYTATFVDQGYCFNAGEWSYADSPLRGVHPRNEVYAEVRGWESFDGVGYTRGKTATRLPTARPSKDKLPELPTRSGLDD